jgi:hypothetical protein
MRELEDRGWLPDGEHPRNLVSAALSNMVNRTGDVEKLSRGTYRLKDTEKLRLPLTSDES